MAASEHTICCYSIISRQLTPTRRPREGSCEDKLGGMAAKAPPAPATFSTAQRHRAIEARAAMTKALKEHRFDEALEHARTAHSLDPNNIMVKEFLKLLEEKQQLAETDDDEEEGAPGQAGQGSPGTAAAGADEESSEDEDDEDEDEDEEGEGETDEGEEDEESEEEEPEPLTAEEQAALAAATRALEAMRLGAAKGAATATGGAGPTRLGGAPGGGMGRAGRSALRSSLAASIRELKQADTARKLMASDPLLGA